MFHKALVIVAVVLALSFVLKKINPLGVGTTVNQLTGF